MDTQARPLGLLLLVIALAATGALAAAGALLPLQARGPAAPVLVSPPPVIGRHCGGIGLVSAQEMCGCVWGHVRFQDDAPDVSLSGVEVELHFANDIISAITASGLGEAPHYALTAERLGARRGNNITLSARYAGYSVTKYVVLEPDFGTGEQLEDLVFPAPRPAHLPTPTPTTTPAPGVSSLGWPREGYDLASTGYYPLASRPIADPDAPFKQVWSYHLPTEGRFFYVYTADVNGDGALEVVLAVYNTVKVLDSNGVELWSRTIPIRTGPYGSGELRLGLLGDVTGDRIPEILLSYKTSPTVGSIVVYDGYGELLTSHSRTAGVATDGDLNVYAILDGADGHKKVYAEMFSNYDANSRGGVLFDEGDGSQDWSYGAGRNLRPSIGDLDGDGDLELASRSWNATANGGEGCGYGWNRCTNDSDLWTVALDSDGDELWSRSLYSLPTGGELRNMIVDLDRDGTKEILALESHWAGAWHVGTSRIHLLDHTDGHIVRTFTGPFNVAWRGGAVADLIGDSRDEVIVGDADGRLRVLDHMLALLRQADVPGKEVGAVNDINGDGRREIIVTNSENGYGVAVLRDDLTTLWSQSFSGVEGATHAIVSDLNGDGVNDLLVSMTGGDLYVFSQAPWSVPTPPPTPTPLPGFRSLILVSPARLAEFHPDQAALMPEVMSRLNQLAAHPDVNGSIVRLEDDPGVTNAYRAWDEHWPDMPGVSATTTTAYANAVAASIKNVIRARVQADPLIRYVVLVGDDRVIPHRRVPDRSPRGFHEDFYPWVAMTTTVGAAMASEQILTDDFYGDMIAEIDPRIAHIPDLAVGRLVESPSQILATVNAFLGQSSIAEGPALVVGCSLIKDLAKDQQSVLKNDGATVRYMNHDSWTVADLRTRLLQASSNLNAVNVHAAHWLYAAPTGGYLTASEIISSNIPGGAVVFTPGCQAGLNIPGNNGGHSTTDFPEAFAARGASYIANTGWGIGDWRSVAFSERLYLEFVAHLAAGDEALLGDALNAAKRAYYETEGDVDGYDEKVLLQATLFGLPQFRVSQQAMSQSDDLSLMSASSQLPRASLTTIRISAHYEPASGTLRPTDTAQGRYYALDNRVQSDDGKPLQPKHLSNLDLAGGSAHGPVFRGGWYEDHSSFDPVVAAASLITGTAVAEPPVETQGWSPPVLPALNAIWGVGEQPREGLVVQFGQYHGAQRVERLYSRVMVDVYYSNSEDRNPPTILTLRSVFAGNLLDLAVVAEDNSGISGVIAAFTAGDGQWQAVDLIEGPQQGAWRGSIPNVPGLEYFLQVVDGAGNVSTDHNNGWYYGGLAPTPTVTPSASPSPTATASPTPSATWTATPTPSPTPTATSTPSPTATTTMRNSYLPLLIKLTNSQ